MAQVTCSAVNEVSGTLANVVYGEPITEMHSLASFILQPASQIELRGGEHSLKGAQR